VWLNSVRAMVYQKVLTNSPINESSDTFYALIKLAKTKRLKIAEIVGCGNLHKFL